MHDRSCVYSLTNRFATVLKNTERDLAYQWPRVPNSSPDHKIKMYAHAGITMRIKANFLRGALEYFETDGWRTLG